MGIVLLTLSLGFAMLCSEVLLRLFWPQELGTWIYTRDGITTHFSNMKQYSNKFGHYIETNSAGMRDREHAVAKAPGQFRILVLGDSFMEAYQVQFQDSFVSLLENGLQAAVGDNVEVINGSVSGWGTDDELTYLVRQGLQYKPDLILVAMTIHNDISDNLMEEYHTFRGGRLEERPIAFMPWASYIILKVKEFLNANLHLYRLVFQASKAQWISEQGKVLESHVGGLLRKVPPERIRMGWDMTEALFAKLVSIGRERGAAVSVILLPLSVQVYPEGLDSFLKWNGLQREEIDLGRPQQLMTKMGQKLDFAVLDLLPVFRAEKESCRCELFVKNDGHWNERGHAIAAIYTVEQLLARRIVHVSKSGL